MADDKIENGLDSGVAVNLGVVTPALEVSGIEQLRANRGEKGASVEPVIAAEGGLWDLLNRAKRPLEQPNLRAIRSFVVATQACIELIKSQAACRLWKSLVRFIQKTIHKRAECSHVGVIHRGEKPTWGRNTHRVEEERIFPSLSTGPSATDSIPFARSRIFFTWASVAGRPCASAARSRRLLMREVMVETNSVFLSLGCRLSSRSM